MSSAKVSDAVAGPYNAIFSTKHWIKQADEACLHYTCVRTSGLGYPTHHVLKYLLSAVMSRVSLCFHIPGELNFDLRKLANIVPFSHSCFFMAGIEPFTSHGCTHSGSNDMIASCDLNRGRLLTCSASFRGRISIREIEDQMKHIQNSNARTAICSVPPQSLRVPATLLGNSTAVQEILDRVGGMEELDFVKAASNLHNSIAEYRQYRHASGSAGEKWVLDKALRGEGERRREGLS
ncbi:tubulin C-terminal domain-like protein [Aspergillus violaceofuscus CBS 115571]|uniref:Tubulin C-terminal domain-like protein n=1 Tax=Aspergillus violaceofuscus (strain CBS 115571) TaxID=1450538 RepID=A0A2V5H6A4_ASPV1|nr:tubulin C-terminal domain-like protein [Aspergillus violaceofuscus CBS 115571]